MRGGTGRAVSLCPHGIGLSPRARGNRLAGHERHCALRSIPACAGEPGRGEKQAPLRSVYPRVRGGTGFLAKVSKTKSSLSPRARGNRFLGQGLQDEIKSIPACAGEPALSTSSAPWTQVYPRVRGGTQAADAAPGDIGGLSPRARGNPSNGSTIAACRGSIPACAGEPLSPPGWVTTIQVYPRVRGGTVSDGRPMGEEVGLSPRARGNLFRTLYSSLPSRSIPACAGEPALRALRFDRLPVYPRVRGGTSLYGMRRFPINGLSPRARGNHARATAVSKSKRSIPACAGEPWLQARRA